MLKYSFSRTPYLFFLALSILVFFIGLIGGDTTLDINIHDTYFVFTLFHFSVLISAILFFNSLIYLSLQKLNRKPIRFLSILHVTFTGISLAILFFSIYYYIPYITQNELTRNYYENYSNSIFYGLSYYNITITFSWIAFLIALVVIFPLNFIIALFRKEKEL